MQRRSTSQDISWFIDLRRHNQLNLDPPYQRRSVWNRKDRQFFLDTIFRGYPCPPVFLHKTTGAGDQTQYAVVDGKQRLQTLFMFVEGEISLGSDFEDIRYDGKSWAEIEDKKQFWDYVIPVEFLMFDENDTKAVNQAFDRLNRNMRKLDQQELRHARWDGWFIKLVEAECDEPVWRKLGIVTNARAKRMKDAQFISELTLLVIENSQTGFDQQTLDTAYAKYDDLEEADLAVDPDDVKERLNSAKDYINAMQDENGCIKAFAATLTAFYTLWAAVVLHRDVLPTASEFASLFSNFYKRVDELGTATDKAPLLTGNHAAQYKRAAEFLEGYRASTDLSPRTKRLEALLGFVRGD